MNTDDDDLKLLQNEQGAPSKAHDRAVFAAIDAAGHRIAKPPRRRVPAWRFAVPLAAAASLVLIPFWLGNNDDPLRNAGMDNNVSPANASELSQPPEQFEWPMQADADAYHFTLRTSDGSVLLETTTEPFANSVTLSAENSDKLLAGRSYFWIVNIDNSVQRQLGPFWFSIEADDAKDQP